MVLIWEKDDPTWDLLAIVPYPPVYAGGRSIPKGKSKGRVCFFPDVGDKFGINWPRPFWGKVCPIMGRPETGFPELLCPNAEKGTGSPIIGWPEIICWGCLKLGDDPIGCPNISLIDFPIYLPKDPLIYGFWGNFPGTPRELPIGKDLTALLPETKGGNWLPLMTEGLTLDVFENWLAVEEK